MLDKLGKMLKTDVRYILRSGGYVMLEHVVAIITGVTYGLLVANVLDPTQYGTYKYVLAIIGIVAAFTLTELSSSLVQSVARGFEGTVRLIMRTQLRWSLPAVLIGVGIAGYYFLQEAYLLGLVILAASLLIPIRDVGGLAFAYLSGKELFNIRAGIGIARAVLTTAILIGILFIISDPKILILSQYVIEAFSFLIILIFVLRAYPPNKQVAEDGVSYGKHLSFIDIIQRLFTHFDKLLVFKFFGAVALASYSIALMPVLQLMSANKAVRSLITPRFAKRSFASIHANIFNKVALVTVVSAIVMVIYMVSAPIIFKYLLPQYVDVIFMTQVASLLLLFTSQSLFGQVLVAHSCKRELYAAAIVGNIFFAIFLVMGGLFGGAFGVLIGFVVSRGANLLIAFLAYLHAHRAYLKVSSQNA